MPHRIGVVFLLHCLIFLTGCPSAPAPAKGSDNELKPLGVLYGTYVGRNQGKAPGSREDLEKFLEANMKDQLKSMGINSPAEVFTSSRDGKPIVVRYGITIPPPGPGGPTIVAYEQDGENGKRLVVTSLGGVEELDEATLKEKVPEFK